MKQNLEKSGGLPMAEYFVIELGKTDLGRQASHELIRTITMNAEKEEITFEEAIKKNKEIHEKLGIEKIEYCLKPENYIGHSEEIVDRVLDA